MTVIASNASNMSPSFPARRLRGTAYCQDFPVVHFEPCRDNNPAFDVYGKLVHGDFTVKAELARTTDDWPGTFNPGIPQFAASRVRSFDNRWSVPLICIRRRAQPREPVIRLSS